MAFKLSKEEKHHIYTLPLAQQFQWVGIPSTFKVKKHVLRSEDAEDYGRVLKVALSYVEEAEVLIMPEIHESEVEIRKRLGIPSPKKNPDLKVGNEWVDVKSPQSVEKLVVNANKAALQGAIACITDDFIDLPDMKHLAKNILSSDMYTQSEVHFYRKGTLYKYNSQGLIA